MTTHDANTMAAAELADRYIETVLATKPELLFSSQKTGSNPSNVQEAAKRLLEYRAELISGLAQQLLSGSELV